MICFFQNGSYTSFFLKKPPYTPCTPYTDPKTPLPHGLPLVYHERSNIDEDDMARGQVGLGVRVDPGLLNELDRVSGDCRLHRSEWVRRALVNAIRAHDLRERRLKSCLGRIARDENLH